MNDRWTIFHTIAGVAAVIIICIILTALFYAIILLAHGGI